MEVMEGRVRSRAVLREFPDYATALACYRSDEYQRAKPLRLPHSQIDFIIVEELATLGTIIAALNSPESKSFLTHNGIDVAGSTPEEFSAYIAAELRRWAWLRE